MDPVVSNLLQSAANPPMPALMLMQQRNNALANSPYGPVSVNSPSSYVPGTIPDITANHIYQSLMNLPASDTGGVNVAQQVQQAQNAQQNPGGGLGGLLGGGLTGAAIGTGIAPGIGTLIGGLLGAGVGLFAPGVLTNPQNAVVKGVQDIENNQAGNILPDAFKQLFGQQAAPNYKQVYQNSFLGKMLPNQSLLGNNNIPVLSGLTNPNIIGSGLFNVATNPYAFIPISGAENAAALTGDEIANAGIQDAVKGVTGSLEGNTLTQAGGVLRNQIARGLGKENYATLLQEGGTNPSLMESFNQKFGNLINQNPSQYINNVGLKIPGLNIPVMSQNVKNAISNNPLISSVNDNLLNNQLSQGFRQLFGEGIGEQKLKQFFGNDVAQKIVGESNTQSAIKNYSVGTFVNDLLEGGKQFSQADLKNARDYIEGSATKLDNPDALKYLQGKLQDLQNYAKTNGVEVPYEVSQYFPKTLAYTQPTPTNAAESILSKVGLTPLSQKRVATTGFFPGQLANIQKELALGKFVDQNGNTLIGNPGELGLTELPKVEGDTNPFGTFMDQNGNKFSQQYLPVTEGNASFSKDFGRNLYEENPLISLASSYQDLAKKVEFNQFANNINNNLRPATQLASGKFSKYINIDPALERLGQAQFKGQIVPDALKDFLNERYKTISQQGNDVLSILNGVGNTTRRLQLLNPIYHQFHNLVPNSMLGGLSPTESIANTLKGLVSPNATKEELLSSDLAKMYTQGGGNLSTLENSLRQGQGILHNLKNISENGAGNPIMQKLKGFDQAQQSMVENADIGNRLSMFKNLLNKGMSSQQAVKTVDNYLFNYQNMSSFEKNYLSNVFPFYQWMKNNTMLWAKNPQALSYWNGGLNAINEATAGHQMALNPANEQSKIKLPWQVGGKDVYLNPMLPFKDISEFSQNPLSFLEGRVNPAISTAAHLTSNTDYFGNQIYNPNLPAGMQSKNVLGMNMDPRLAYALGNLSLFTQPLAAPTTGNTGALGIMDLLTGAKTSAVKPSDQSMSNYYTAKAVMDAMAQAEQKAGNLTYQQANPYNTSPATQNYISNLISSKYTYEDELYGGHYISGKFVPATGIGLERYLARTGRQQASRQRMYSKMKIKQMLYKYM